MRIKKKGLNDNLGFFSLRKSVQGFDGLSSGLPPLCVLFRVLASVGRSFLRSRQPSAHTPRGCSGRSRSEKSFYLLRFASPFLRFFSPTRPVFWCAVAHCPEKTRILFAPLRFALFMVFFVVSRSRFIRSLHCISLTPCPAGLCAISPAHHATAKPRPCSATLRDCGVCRCL